MAFKSDLDALILAVLSDRDLHGYEISKSIKQKSGEALKFGEGQLYPALHKLESDGMIAANWVPQEGKPDRKVYSITTAGHTVLNQHISAWKKFSDGVASILSQKSEENR